MEKRLQRQFRNSNFLLLCWWLLCTSIHFIVLRRLGYTQEIAWFDAVVSNSTLCLLSFILKRIQNFYHSKQPITVVNIGTIKIFTLIYLFVVLNIGSYFFPQDSLYACDSIHQNLMRGITAFLLLLVVLYQLWLFKSQQSQQKNVNHLLEIERQLNRAELSNIQQQLQPHFLFNSLNSISALTVTQPEEARRMVHLLSDFLRGTLRKEQEQQVNLKEEMTHLNLYLEIEKVRFGHRLNIDFHIDETCENALMPALMLQPIVENAIKYGLYGQLGALTISIEATCDKGFLTIRISNPYDAQTVNASRGIGFGLTSIERKLYLIYAQNNLLKIAKTENQFTTILHIPQV